MAIRMRIRPLRLLFGRSIRFYICFIVTLGILLSLVGFHQANYASLPRKQELTQNEQELILDGHVGFLDHQATVSRPAGKARKNLIIVSHGRSGSTLTGDIFNHHPKVFYMYEPLQTVERTHKQFNNFSCFNCVEDFLANIFRCSFDEPRYLEDINFYYRKPVHPRVSRAIASPPLCPYNMTDSRWDPTLCPPMTSESLGNTCKNTYDLTVIKVLMSRIPDIVFERILTACNPEKMDCKIVFLIRDPRAVIASSASVNFFHEEDSMSKAGTRLYSYTLCRQTEENLVFVKNLPQRMRDQIKLLRYEDLALNPLEELERLYKFAGLSVLESVRTWLNETTQTQRRDCGREGAVCTKDDAWSAVNRWRWLVDPHVIDIIELYCGHAMHLMGYQAVDRSYELLTNVKIPLFSTDYEARKWGLQ